MANGKNVIAIFIIHILIANLHVAVWPFTFILYLPYVAEYLIAEFIDIVLYKKIKVIFLKKRIKKIGLKSSKKDVITKKWQILNDELQKTENRIEKIQTRRIENENKVYKIKIEKNKNVRWLILIMIIAVLTGFLTPLGKTPFTYTYLTMKGNTINNINEHLPLTLANNTPMFCTIIVIFILIAFTDLKIRLSDLFMLSGLCFLMFASRRQQSVFVLIGSIPFTRMVINYIKIHIDYPIEDMLAKVFNKFTAFILISLTLSLALHLYSKTKNDKYINEKTYPVQASEWILDNLDVDNIKIFNEYNYGSYLLYKGIPVFIDSRADLYTSEFNTSTESIGSRNDIFSDFINTSNIGTYYGEIFEKYNITHVILYKNSKVNMLIKKADPEKYEEIYSDNSFIIYEIINY